MQAFLEVTKSSIFSLIIMVANFSSYSQEQYMLHSLNTSFALSPQRQYEKLKEEKRAIKNPINYPYFKNCNDAKANSLSDLENKELKLFLRLSHYKKSGEWEHKFDSVMLANYDIEVIRNGNYEVDMTLKCYNASLNAYMKENGMEDFGEQVARITGS